MVSINYTFTHAPKLELHMGGGAVAPLGEYMARECCDHTKVPSFWMNIKYP